MNITPHPLLDCVSCVASRGAKSVLIGALLSATAAFALPTVSFVATDLADTTVGEDLWRYDYLISGPLGVFEAVNLLFSPTDYGALSSVAGAPQLDLLPIDPDAGLPANGMLTATALTTLAAGATANATVSFVWLAIGTQPGAQAFEHLDDGFNVIGNGLTRPVPEASTALLLLGGLLLVPWAVSRRRTRRQA